MNGIKLFCAMHNQWMEGNSSPWGQWTPPLVRINLGQFIIVKNNYRKIIDIVEIIGSKKNDSLGHIESISHRKLKTIHAPESPKVSKDAP